MARKNIELAPTQTAPEEGVFYSVRVIQDTRPNNPGLGKYIVEIVEKETSRTVKESRALEAQRIRASRMRTSPWFRSMAKLIHDDPDLHEETMQLTERRDEFIADTQPKKEMYREFAPYFAGVVGTERGQQMLDLVIDSTIKERSDGLKQGISFFQFESDKPYFFPEVIIGSGPISAAMEGERMALAPNYPRLIIEKRMRIGGQFAQQMRHAWEINNRTRRENLDNDPIPGTKGNLSSLGRVPIQVSDLSHQTSASQKTVGLATKINGFLDSNFIVETEVLKVQKNTGSPPGSIRLLLRDTSDQKTFEITTDRLIDTAGLDDRVRFAENDFITEAIFDREAQALQETGRARVYTYPQYMEMVGNPTEPFPLEGMGESVAIIGWGDGALTILKNLFGYGVDLGKTRTQFEKHRPKKVIVISDNVPRSRESFLARTRPTYAEVGNEFPRRESPDYFHRVRPIASNSERLRDANNGQIIVKTENGGNIAVDTVIDASGYKQSFDIYNPLFEDVLRGVEVQEKKLEIFSTKGTKIFFRTGPISLIEIISVTKQQPSSVPSFLTYKIFFKDPNKDPEIVEERFMETQDLLPLTDSLLSTGEVDKVIKRTDMDEKFDGFVIEGGPTDPVAKKTADLEIYLVGARSRLPVTREERIQSEAFSAVPQNSAALFRFLPKAQALENFLRTQKVNADNKSTEKARDLLNFVEIQDAIKLPVLAELSPEKIEEDPYRVEFLTRELKYRLPESARAEDYIKLVLGKALSGIKFQGAPQFLLEFNVSQTTAPLSADYTEFIMASNGFGLREELEELDITFYRALYRLSNRPNLRSSKISIAIPIKNDIAVPTDMSISLVK